MEWFVIFIIFFIILVLLITMRSKSGRGEFRGNLSIIGGSEVELEIDDLRNQEPLIEYRDIIGGDKNIFDTHSKLYLLPESDKQIQQIIKYGGIQDYSRLIQTLGKPLFKLTSISEKVKVLREWTDAKQTDSEIYAELCKYSDKNPFGSAIRDKKQAREIYRTIKDHIMSRLPYDKKIEKVLDVGCGTAGITNMLKEFLGLKSINCIEIDRGIKEVEGVEYKYMDPDFSDPKKKETWKFPYETGSFDLVLSIMTLHHVEKNLDDLIWEIYRVLKPGGKLFIKEHDTWTAFDAMLVDIEHHIYRYCYGIETKNKYYCRHMNYWGWVKLLGKYFVPDSWGYYYINIKHDINPTRAIWAIFTKK